jgi:methylenetetrahydrofolate--tRNA-(uracil-5-)-methyltransferase
LLAGLNAAHIQKGEQPITFPRTTMMGALCHYITHADLKDFQPMKSNLGILPPLEDEDSNRRSKLERAKAFGDRSKIDLESIMNADRI